jgi:hypothetical protein
LSLEDQLSSIENLYKISYEMLSNIYNYTSYRTLDYITHAIKNVLSLQRMIELLCEDIKKLSDEKTKSYVDRFMENVIKIQSFIRIGVCHNIDSDDFLNAFFSFKKVRSLMYQIIEDIKLIYALKLYPIEEKMALKSLLTDYGFLEVTKCLDEAETNLAEKHYKDCIDRGREALEKTVTSILTVEGKKPSGSFSTDIGSLSGVGIIDKETKKLTEATYSYFSEVGAHGRAGEVTAGDAHYSLKEVYMRIDILLKKYSAYLSRKTR